jgi:lycopene cyclase domain-containing protein
MPTALTYLQVHAIFVVPPLSALVAAAGWRRETDWRVDGAGVAVLLALAILYTTPWDAALLAQGVWWYGDSRVTGWLFGVPLGEFLFFGFQTLLTGLWTVQVAGPVVDGVSHGWRDRLLGAGAGVGVAVFGLGLLAIAFTGAEGTLYLGAILAWAGPVLALQWAFGWQYLLRVRRRVALAVGVPTLYLWAVDSYAIADGVWIISEQYTTGLAVAGLPVEEMLFFLVTNCFIVQGLVLFRWVMDRWR